MKNLLAIVLIMVVSIVGLPTLATELTLKEEILKLEGLNKTETVGSAEYELIFVDFWASWCDPCKDSFPYYEKLMNDKKNKKILFVTINLDDDKESGQKFLKEFPTDFPTYWDKSKALMKRLNFDAIPHMIVLNNKWELKDTIKGFNTKSKDKVKKLIKSIK